MTVTLEDANAAVRSAVEIRNEAQATGKPQAEWYGVTEPMTKTKPAEVRVYGHEGGCGPSAAEVIERFNPTHPTSQAFFDLCDALKEMHRRKSSDYGCPNGTDPLANIRNGAAFVGIPAWKGAMVRLSDKVTRLATFNATGRLSNESLEDNLFDLASYSLLALLLHREEQGK